MTYTPEACDHGQWADQHCQRCEDEGKTTPLTIATDEGMKLNDSEWEAWNTTPEWY